MDYSTSTNIVQVWTEEGVVKISTWDAVDGLEHISTVTIEPDQIDDVIAALSEAKEELVEQDAEEAANA